MVPSTKNPPNQRENSSQNNSNIFVARPSSNSHLQIRRIQTVPKLKRSITQVTETIDSDELPKHRNLYNLAPNIKIKSKVKKCTPASPPSHGVIYSPTSIVNPLIRPDGLGVRFPNYHALAGTYDIVFYFAQWNGDYIHHRTTKGTLLLSVSNEESVYCKERRMFIRRKIPRGGETLKGVVCMDNAVKQGDRISMGWYNFTFLQNNLRLRVVIDPGFHIDLSEEQIRKANAEIDIHVKGCQDDREGSREESLNFLKKRLSNSHINKTSDLKKTNSGEASIHRGRIKLVAQRAPLHICQNQQKERGNSHMGKIHARHEKAQFHSVKDAQNKLCKYVDVDNSWLSKHIDLPKDVLSVIHQFICPPPVFFFEEGDLWIEVDWNFRKGDLNSIFVARKRS